MLRVRAGEIIRNKQSREPYLVIGKSPQGLYVVSLIEGVDPAVMRIILGRASYNFELDKQIVDMSQDEAKELQRALPIVEELQKTIK